jgi:tetratricopeptide (TPR) repeat protein
LKPKTSPERAQRYTDKILSDKYDVWTLQLAVSLRDETQDIFAGLEDTPKPKAPDRPDVSTLLLLEDENDRVASAPARKGQPRIAQDSETIHTRLHEKATSPDKDTKHFVAIHEPYPPSTSSVRELKPINLADLKQEIHHRGNVLQMRRCGPIIHLGSGTLVCAVQDESGDTEALEVHHISQALGEHILHMDDLFAVKEPYFTINSDDTAVIRVDHPTDIILSSAEIQTTASGSNPPESRTAAEWKQAGNDLLGQKQLWKARDAYRTGLSGEADGRLRLDLARNLARVDLELTKYDEAKSSAKEAVSDGSDTAMANLDVKAYYRAATAAYNLRQYGEAQDCVDKLLKLDVNDAEGKRETQRIHSRLDEQKTGQYDFEKIVSRLSPQNSRIDIADFTQRVHVAASSVGGRGLFASCDMEIGDIVLCEKAFCSTFEKDKSWYAAWEYNNGKLSMASSTMALWDEMVQKMLNNPSTIPAVTNLGGDYTGIGNEAGSVDDTTVLDTFQIRSIIESNAFGIPTPSKRHRTRPFGFTAEHQEQTQLGDNTGIFLKTAMMNHSCVPNTRKYFIGDAILIRATRPILKGEELLQSYAQTDADVGERRQMLESTWHFHCNCKLCVVEEKESDDKRKKRDTLERRKCLTLCCSKFTPHYATGNADPLI